MSTLHRLYQIIDVKNGSFSQGHEKFGDSSGYQCAAMSLMSICWTKIKSFKLWRQKDLDNILDCGDSFYKHICDGIGTIRYLSIDDLPAVVHIGNENANVSFHNIFDGRIQTSDGHYSTRLVDMTKVRNVPYPITGFLLIMQGMVFSLFLDNHSTHCFLFDSHSRNSEAIPSSNGTSVIVTFDCLESLENYLFLNHCRSSTAENIYFQVCQVEVQLSAPSKTKIIAFLQKEDRKRKYQENKENKKEKSRQSYSKNHDSILHKAKKAYMENPTSKIEKVKLVYAKNCTLVLERAKNAYKENPTPKLQRERRAYKENPTPKLQRGRRAYRENPTPILQRAKRAYKENPSPVIERASQRYYNNPDIKEQNRLRKIQKKEISNQLCVENFRSGIWQGPYYICVICNRTLYQKSVKLFNEEKYPNLDFRVVTNICSFDGKVYICITCDSKSKKQKMPCQSVANKLSVGMLPPSLSNLRELEKILIARRILFKKIVVIHGKGEFPKVKGTLCNVPIQSNEIANVLPREADSNGLLLVKLKRQLKYKNHYMCEPVRPNIIIDMLNYLKANNFLYEDVTVLRENIDENLIELDAADDDEPTSNSSEENFTHMENPQSQFQISSNETVMIPTIPHISEEESLIIAPGQGQTPLSMLTDQYCEELAFPYLFPNGKFGYKVERDVKLSPSKYFNQRLLNYSQRFASDSNYIFFARALLEHLHIQSSINTSLLITKSRTLTAGQFHGNFNETVSSFVSQNDAFKFMRSIRGSPSYWKQFLSEVLAMVKQLGLPSYFFTLSCADLKWDEFIYHISKLNGENLTKEDISNMSYKERATWLNANPVLLARHFQFRTQLFFKDILLNGSLGITEYYCYRVEFQQRGSPHIHGFLWIKDFPRLTELSTQMYVNYLDQVISTSLPDPVSEPELFEYVKTFQIHHHSRTCWKYLKSSCRFHFGKYFSERTIISLPLPVEIDEDLRLQRLEWRKDILDKVKNYIDQELNPSKKNIINPFADDFEEPKSIDEILTELEITKEDYYTALSISKDKDYEIHFKRPSNSCFVNNYFAQGLLAWNANIDIQPIFNHYKAVTYMCSYMSKSEEECTIAMMQAVKESLENGHPYYEQMKKVALAYATKRQCSVQEAVYHCLPELHLRRIFPGTIFANSNLPEQRYRILKKREEIDELPSDSQDIFQRGNLERYMGRPNLTFHGGRYAIINNFCFVEFLAHYDVIYKKDDCEDDYQPDQLPDDLIEANHTSSNYPKKIKLMDSKETLRLRKVQKVVRYGIPKNREINPESYAHHLLFLFYPFRKETDLLFGNPPTYCAKLNNPDVINVVNEKRQLFEPYAEMVDEALLQYSESAQPSYDPEGAVENDETNFAFPHEDDDSETRDNNTSAQSSTSTYQNPLVLPDDEICKMINTLNSKQRKVFNIVFTWARRSVKFHLANIDLPVDPLHIFLSGSGGVGKSHLVKTIYHAVSKTFLMRASDPLKPRVLLLAPTGVAAINIDGTTIHSGLGISLHHNICKLSDKHRSDLRNKLSDVKLIIIDEISMVSNKLFYQVSKRLSEIFGCSDYIPFAGLSVIVCGDLYQLPPVQASPIYYAGNKERTVDPKRQIDIFLMHDLWKKFKYIELTEIMRQSDQEFIGLLNRVRIGKITEADKIKLSEKFITSEDTIGLKNALHIFAENAPARKHNNDVLESIDNPLYLVFANDALPRDLGIPPSKIIEAQNRKQQETGGLAKELKIKVGARVMLTVNIDLADKLINGLMGVVHFIKVFDHSVKIIYVKFDNEDAGQNAMRNDAYGLSNKCVPIHKCETDIKIIKNHVTSPVIKRTQFPLSLAWACTVHKVQGLSLSEAVISFNLEKQRSFNAGQMYVALSRVKTFDGLYLRGEFTDKVIKVNNFAKEEYERLRKESPLATLPHLTKSKDSLTVVVSNVRSLSKHVDDIFLDASLIDADIIGFTETGLLPHHDVVEINNKKGEFGITYNTVDQQECSLAILYSPEVHLVDHFKQDSFSVMKFQKNEFQSEPVTLLLLYRKNNSQNGFLEILYYLAISQSVDIIMGDFNINALVETEIRLQQIFENYEMIVTEPTHLQGALLDHVYIKKSLLETFQFQCLQHCVFYSDHDAVKFKLSRPDVDFNIE